VLIIAGSRVKVKSCPVNGRSSKSLCFFSVTTGAHCSFSGGLQKNKAPEHSETRVIRIPFIMPKHKRESTARIADPSILSSSTKNGSRPYVFCSTVHRSCCCGCEQRLSANLRRSSLSRAPSCLQNRDSSVSSDFHPISFVSRAQPACYCWHIEILCVVHRKVEKKDGDDCAIGGRSGTFSKDWARHVVQMEFDQSIVCVHCRASTVIGR